MSVICPHCNAINTATDAEFQDCSRCGERFASARAEQAETTQPPVAISGNSTPGFLYSRGAVYLSFALAALILVGGLAIVRPWEPRRIVVQQTKPPVVVSPLGLSGLTYFPPNTNVLAAVQPLPLLAYAARTKTDPRKFLQEAGVPETIFKILDRAKIPLDQVDHLVIGLAVSSEVGKVLPGFTACLKLTRPLTDEAAFLAELRAEKNSQQSKGRTVYSVNAGLPLLLTKIDPQTYFLGLSADDFASLEKPHSPGGGHLPKDLRDGVTTQLDPTSFVWFGTDSDRWTEKPFVTTLGPKAKLPTLATGRAILGAVSLEPDPRLQFTVRTADAASAATVQEFFRKKLGERVKISAREELTFVELPFDPKESVLKSLFEEVQPPR